MLFICRVFIPLQEALLLARFCHLLLRGSHPSVVRYLMVYAVVVVTEQLSLCRFLSRTSSSLLGNKHHIAFFSSS